MSLILVRRSSLTKLYTHGFDLIQSLPPVGQLSSVFLYIGSMAQTVDLLGTGLASPLAETTTVANGGQLRLFPFSQWLYGSRHSF
jgi:hypothetical protein